MSADRPVGSDPTLSSPQGDGLVFPATVLPETLAARDEAHEATGQMRAALDPVLPLPKPKKKKKEKEPKFVIDPDNPDALFESLGPVRGVETLFRTSYRVNMDLTALADAKANIMISINGLIVSILIAAIAPKVDANPWLLFPTSIFLIGCVVSLVFAVLSARPRVQTRTTTLDEVRRLKPNILFFGNFSSLPMRDYVTAMKERMQSPTDLYELMITDIYGVGSVLQRKYTLLRASYGAFLIALIVGVTGFILVFFYAAYMQAGPLIIEQALPADPSVLPGLLP